MIVGHVFTKLVQDVGQDYGYGHAEPPIAWKCNIGSSQTISTTKSEKKLHPTSQTHIYN
jgi:hypothetical protein